MQDNSGFWGVGLALVVTACFGSATAAEPYRAGVGKVEITPKEPIRLAGYASRNKPSEGVDQPLYLKALALQDGEHPPLILITADIIGFPRSITEKIADRLRTGLNIPRENVLVIASHTHTGPIIASSLESMYNLQGTEAERVLAFAQALPNHAFHAATTAVQQLKPARLSFGRSKASFAMNRRVFRPGGVGFGANPEGAVDHEVPVLRIEDAAGTVFAILFGYACHCTTMRGDSYRISGDWAGFAQEYLERAYPGAVAYFVTGCGGDADPQPNGKIDLARQHGLEMAGAVAQALKGRRTALTGPMRTVFDRVDLPLAKPPSREEFEKRLHDRDVYVQRHARRQLQTLERRGKLPVSYPSPVQVWQLGNELTLAALGGEVVVDYALRLKREFAGSNLWVAGYANDVFAYIPSVRVLLEGGYEADYAMLYYGLPARFDTKVEDVLVKKVNELVEKVRH
jgi:hypothetical protein